MKETNKRPNLLFIFPDQFRKQAMGFMNQDPVETPNIDKLASEGLVVHDVVSTYPVCTPYRGMLMTGRYPFATGITSNCNTENTQYGVYLKPEERCFSDVLAEAGFEPGYVGKWHLDPPQEPYEYLEPRRSDGRIWDAFTPIDRRHGFTFWYSYGCCDKHEQPHYWSSARIEERIDVNQWSTEHEVDVIIQYLQNEKTAYRDPNKPFALFWSPNPPHPPFQQVPDRYKPRYASHAKEELLNRPNVPEHHNLHRLEEDARHYFAMVSGVDEQIGRVLQALEDSGQADDTLVIFTSDHGEMLGSHGRMQKSVWYEESYGVPFIIRWRKAIAPGERRLLLGTPDLMPTILSLLGCKPHIPDSVQGKDYADTILTDSGMKPDAALYIRTLPAHMDCGARGIKTERYTYVQVRESDGSEQRYLFDNVLDPYQLTNECVRQPDRVKAFDQELARRLGAIGDSWVD